LKKFGETAVVSSLLCNICCLELVRILLKITALCGFGAGLLLCTFCFVAYVARLLGIHIICARLGALACNLRLDLDPVCAVVDGLDANVWAGVCLAFRHSSCVGGNRSRRGCQVLQ